MAITADSRLKTQDFRPKTQSGLGSWVLGLGSIRASFSIEYAVLIAIVVAALLGMSVYTKRALMGRWREAGDTFGSGRQYEPGVTVTQ